MSDISWPKGGDRPFPALTLIGRPLNARTLAAAEAWLNVAGIGAWHHFPDGDLWWSAETRRIHGVGDDFRPDLATAIDFYLPEHRPIISDAVARSVATGESWDLELGIIRADGQRCQVRARGRSSRPGNPRAGAIIGTFEDISARHDVALRAAQELELRTRTETLLRDVITSIPGALSVYDSEERLILVNENYRNILPGNRHMMVPGETLADIVTRKVAANHYVPEISGNDPPELQAAWVANYLRQHRTPGYNRIFHLRGDTFVQSSAATSDSGNVVSIRWDVTALKRAERALRHRAERDPLTGLANRHLLLQQLEHLCASADDRYNEHRTVPGVLVLLDVDFFKAVNDSLGHAAGDLLLRLIARRLQRLAGPGDTAARLAGDEFAMIIHGPVGHEAVSAFAARLLQRLHRPMRLGPSRYAPSLSVGIAPFPAAACGPRELMGNADVALLDAKRLGRGRHVLFGPALAEQVTRRTRLADALRRAVAQRQFQAALQPQQRLSDGQVIGFEALARWQLDGQWIPPSDFIALAEDIGLAQPLGQQVMHAALRSFAAMLKAGMEPGMLAVNVTTAQLLADDFIETVRRALAEHGVPATRLELEVTEGVLLDRSIARIGQTLHGLRDLGCSLAMDDFGTGYASLSHLTTFPVDRIKIDRSFTSAIDSEGDRGLIARTLIGLGRGLGLEVIAEGVETETQRAFLLAHGCTAIQGYLFAKPMLAAEALPWLALQEKRPRPCVRRPAIPNIG